MSIAKELWQEILPVLEVELNTLSFDLWIKPVEPLDVEDNKLILLVPTETNRDFINGSLRPVIERVLASVNPLYREITLVLQSEVESMGGNLAEIIEEEKKEEEQPKVMDAMLFNSRYTFDSFVVGECNRLAVAAARAVAENPGENYNPLFIYGGSGLGKTHIMHAIGNYIRKNNRKMKVLYVSSEKFVNDLVLSIHNRSGSSVDFRDKYRSVDVLMIDDIQQIAGKEKTQIELFNTFNDLYQNGMKPMPAGYFGRDDFEH
jgi:chromosomal replication initiator protein